jgi:hypothetical protein
MKYTAIVTMDGEYESQGIYVVDIQKPKIDDLMFEVKHAVSREIAENQMSHSEMTEEEIQDMSLYADEIMGDLSIDFLFEGQPKLL